jgi:hypothetical protein
MTPWPTFLLAILLLAMPGCVGSPPPQLDPDAAPPMDARAVDARPPIDAALVGDAPYCYDEVLIVGDGKHHPGVLCIAGCHDDDPNDAAPQFFVAGTMYTGPNGNAPQPGATVVVIDAVGNEYRMVSQANGNFYSLASMIPPLQVRATQCPDSENMIAATAGDCNAGGCHDSAANAGRVHVR